MTMKRYRNIKIALTALLALTACSSEDDPTTAATADGKGLEPVVLYASVDNGNPSEAGITRASAGNTWAVGDLVAVQMDGVVKKYKVTNASTGKLEPFDLANTHHWKSSSDSKTITAWYYGDGTYNATHKAITVPTTQTSTTVQDCDLLYAPAVTVSYTNRSSSALTFYHQMSKLVFNFKINDEFNDKTITSFTMDGGNLTGTFAVPSSGNYGTWTTSGNGSTVNPFKTTTTSGYDATYVAILLPQSRSNSSLIYPRSASWDGTTSYGSYLSTMNSETNTFRLKPGYTYTYNITINREGFSIAPGTINGWTTDSKGSVEANF